MGSHDIYPTLSGAIATWREVEVVASNLANANSTGFKEHLLSFELQDRGAQPLESSYVKVNPAGVDMTTGPITQTGVSTHLALSGDGFLMAQAEDGENVLVRSGDLRLDQNNFLVTQRGEKVLGIGGPIQVPLNQTLEVANDGTVFSRIGDGTEFAAAQIGQLQLVTADDLEPLGGARYRALSRLRPSTDTTVTQGALEGSNVDAIGGMVSLIQASRHFELYQRAMKSSDELDAHIYRTLR